MGSIIRITERGGQLRYCIGQKWCKRCGEYRYPDDPTIKGYHKGKIGHFCNDCGGRVRSAPRHSADRKKYVEDIPRI